MAIGFDPKLGRLGHNVAREPDTDVDKAKQPLKEPVAMDKPKGLVAPKAAATHPTQLAAAPNKDAPPSGEAAELRARLVGERAGRARAARDVFLLVSRFATRRTRPSQRRALALLTDVAENVPEAQRAATSLARVLEAEGRLHELTPAGTEAACAELVRLLDEHGEDSELVSAAPEVGARARATLSRAFLQLAMHFPKQARAQELSVELLLSQAVLLAEEAVMLAPELPDGHAALGRALLAHGDPEADEDARLCFESALTLDAEHDPAVSGLAALALAQGRVTDALAAVDLLSSRGNSLPHTLFLRGLVLMALGRHEDARRELERAMRLAPDAGLLALDAARLFRQLGDEAQAVACEARAEELLGLSSADLVAALVARPG